MTLILSGSDGLSDVDGTAAAPALRGTDTNTGIFFPAADTIAFAEGGAEVMRIDSSGNVGIGTNSPTANARVSVFGNNSSVQFQNASTGTSATDGGLVGNNGGAQLYLYNYENDAVIFGTNNTERARIDSSGNLLVGTTSVLGASAAGTTHITGGANDANEAPLYLRNQFSTAGRYWKVGPVNNAGFLVFNNSNVGQYQSYGATSWTATSDERLKTNLLPIENAAQKISSLRAVTGRYKTDEQNVSRSFLIAQDVQAVFPEAVDVQDDEQNTLGLRYTEVIPLLVAAIQEQQALITALTTRITALEAA